MTEDRHPFLSVVIPAYNEEHRLGPTLARVAEYLAGQSYEWEIVVVDNGSKDRTSEVARGAGVKVIAEPRRGKGAAVRTGMLAARGEYVLFSDADLSTPIEEVDKLMGELQAGADVAIASRGLPESNLVKRQPWYRELVGRAGNVLVRLTAVRGIADTQCGFKLFPNRIVHRVFPAQRLTGAAFDVEVLFIVQHAGWKIAEVPVTWIDSPDTRFSRIRDSLDALKDLVRIRMNWLRGRYRV